MTHATYAPRVNVHPDRYGAVKTSGPNLWAILHTSEGGESDTAAENLGYVLTLPGDRPNGSGGKYGSSYNDIADTDQIIPAVPHNVVAYAAAGANAQGIHLCFPGRAGQTRDQWLDDISRPMIRQAAAWLVDVHDTEGIPLERITAGEMKQGRSGVADHFTATEAFGLTDHTDVGPGFPWEVLWADVAAITTPPAPPSGDDMRPIVTTWAGEPWPILVGFDPATSQYTWRGIPGPEVDELIARGAAVDGRATPWPAVWKSATWMKRLG